ncbi:RNA-binding protein [Candidatus Woesearchaeota archaeon]|nr:RNA-binding protein [Candidatus Woesearchaeota archaeon]
MKTLSNKEIRQLNLTIEHFGYEIPKKSKVIEDDKLTKVDGETLFFFKDKVLLPSLKLLVKETLTIKHVVVDMGAVKFVVNGADIMRPGITHIDEGIEKDDFVVIVDENNKKPLAVGQALLDAEDMTKAEKGKVVKSIHHVGDEVWNA